ncbi:MAG: hypothetical protein ACQCN6_10000 [Candidatus Bathyarchaeia archaeon]|jgi:hypothetical protein
MENNKKRAFTVELKSKHNLKNLTLTNGNTDTVLFEGTIGEFVDATFTEGIVLEIIGKDGILRIDLAPDEIKKNTKKQEVEPQ